MSLSTRAQRSGWVETFVIVAEALAIAMFVRIFFYQPFNIPSGSMKETLLIGDYLFVSKLSYGYSKYSFPRTATLCIPWTTSCTSFRVLPDMISSGRVFAADPKRGDVAVFRRPLDTDVDYIKRVIGLPGDEIQMVKGQLFINGTAVPKVPAGEFITRESQSRPRSIPVYEETLPNGVKYKVLAANPANSLNNTGVYKVPPGHYFMMGDNRDNSTDSRVQDESGVGYVPLENFVGRAEIIFFSAPVDDPDALKWWSPWTWPFDIRWSRFFNLVR
jgi:signal peptidase I